MEDPSESEAPQSEVDSDVHTPSESEPEMEPPPQLNGSQRSSMTEFSHASSVQDLSASQKKYLQSHFAESGDEVLYARTFKVQSKKVNKEKLIAAGNYRLLVLGKGAFGKAKADKDIHYFNLKEVKTDDGCHTLHLNSKEFSLELTGDGIPDLVLVLRSAVLRITGDFPASAMPTFNTNVGREITITHGEDRGFLASYKAWCSYFHKLPSQNFVHYVESTVGQTKELMLHECSGIEPKTAHTIDLEPVAAALRYNTYFRTLGMCNIPRKEAVSLLSSAIGSNTALTKLVLSGLEAEHDAFVQLGDALKQNPSTYCSADAHNTDTALVEIDLSHNQMKDQGLICLAVGLSAMKHGLKKLNISHCAVQAKGIVALMKAFDSNHGLSLSIEVLDLSHNFVGTQGTTAISNWLSNMRQGEQNMSSLINLNLAGCQVDIFVLMQALQSSIKDKLEALDISYNKITKQSVESVAEFLTSCEALKMVKLANCALVPEVLEPILEALNKNDICDAVSLDLSGNDLGLSGAKVVAKVTRYSKNIHTLILKSNNLKKEGLREILKALEQNNNIKGLDISDNVKGKNVEIVKALADILSNDTSGLEYLCIADNGLGKETEPIFKALATNSKVLSCTSPNNLLQLKELDISGNHIGDGAAITLAEAISRNSTLTSLKWDENHVNLGGWQTFCSALKNNKSMVSVPTPEKDVMRSIGSAKDKAKHREKVTEVMAQIAQITKDNAHAQSNR